MIKNNIGLLLLVFGLFCFTSCDDEFVKPFEQASLEAAHLELGAPTVGFFDKGDFANAASSFSVNALGDGGVSVSSVDVIAYRKNGITNATEGPVSVGSVATLPSDFAVTLADLAAAFSLTEADVNVGDIFTFFFEMQTSVGTLVQGGPASARSVALPVSCPSDLAGMYSVTTTYGFHDFLPDFATNTTTAEIIEEGDGIYSVADFSGGLYAPTGPYGINYGTDGLPVNFLDICNNISWTNQSDPWGACIPAPTGTNSVDITTGVITVSWFCEGYGENGVSVYTPQ
jgi:hypothetical protein